MQIPLVLRILGFLLILFSLTLLPPIVVAIIFKNWSELWIFSLTLLGMLGVGLLLSRKIRVPVSDELQFKDGYLVTVLFWVVLSLVSALPFIFSVPELHLARAVFEAVSGFTTTGATALTGLDDMPKSILYYRQQLQVVGGMGVIVAAIAVMPMLGVGGLQLYRAEAPGPMHDDKLTPRLKGTVKALFGVYLGLVVACVLAYMWAGMGFFDALMHSYTTVSTGGFSPYDASLGYFNSLSVELVAMVFMLLGALNFTVHYMALHRGDLGQYWRDVQIRVFLGIVLVVSLVCALTLTYSGTFDFWNALRHSAFHVISVITTSGYTTQDFSKWPLFVPVLIMLTGFIGGCVGSTAGGFRVMRIIVLTKQGLREITRMLHPNAVIPLRVGQKKLNDRVAEAVSGFAFLYAATFLVLALLMLACGLEPVAAFSAAATTLNMVGPALGEVSSNFASVNDAALWVGTLGMLLGRLEIFTLLVLFMPSFWNR